MICGRGGPSGDWKIENRKAWWDLVGLLLQQKIGFINQLITGMRLVIRYWQPYGPFSMAMLNNQRV